MYNKLINIPTVLLPLMCTIGSPNDNEVTEDLTHRKEETNTN
jgi:hypothetical protein